MIETEWAPCDKPHKLEDLGFGRHVFRVRAIADGVRDPSPAKDYWRVIPAARGKR